ncbi:MAG: RNA polymerase-interacting CarD/CdnL/TRCF family regulator, partial [Kiritimatiellia bacterium]
MLFSAGDPVVAAGCGVGVVEDVEAVDADGQGIFMYRMWFPTNKMRMWVPVARAAADGVRAPMSADEAEEVLTVVENHSAPEER